MFCGVKGFTPVPGRGVFRDRHHVRDKATVPARATTQSEAGQRVAIHPKHAGRVRPELEHPSQLIVGRPGDLGGCDLMKGMDGAHGYREKYPDEPRERAVAMVFELRRESGSTRGSLRRRGGSSGGVSARR